MSEAITNLVRNNSLVKIVQKIPKQFTEEVVDLEESKRNEENVDYLSALELVEVDDSSSSPSNTSKGDTHVAVPKGGSSGVFVDRKKLPYFDFMPDEVCVYVYSHLNEEQMVIMGRVCKRFYGLLNEKTVWEAKSRGWIHLQASTTQQGQDALRNYYIQRYKDNKQEQAKRDKAVKEEAAKLRERKIMMTLDTMLTNLFYERYSMDWPAMISLILWTILLVLRMDEILLLSFHQVNLPLYLIFLWFLLGLSLSNLIDFGLSKTKMEWRSNQRKWKNTKSLMRLFIKPFYSGLAILCCLCVTIFFVMLAEFEDQRTDVLWPAMIPLIFCSMALACATGWELWFAWCWFSLYVVWQIVFIWVKGEFIVHFNWYTAMVPLWVGAGGSFLGMCITSIVFTTCAHSGWDVALVLWGITLPLGLLTGWLVHLCYNLEQDIVDLPMHPWSVVFILIWVLYVFGLGVCGFLEYKVRT